jgi:hypothetical protein
MSETATHEQIAAASSLFTLSSPARRRPLGPKPWRGGWGTLGDGRSKLSLRRKRHLAELLIKFPSAPRGELEALAAAMALRDKAVAEYGADPKISITTVRKFESMVGVRHKELAAQAAARDGRANDLAAALVRSAREPSS